MAYPKHKNFGQVSAVLTLHTDGDGDLYLSHVYDGDTNFYLTIDGDSGYAQTFEEFVEKVQDLLKGGPQDRLLEAAKAVVQQDIAVCSVENGNFVAKREALYRLAEAVQACEAAADDDDDF